MSASLPEPEAAAFELLKPRLCELWRQVFPRDDEAYTSVVVPSISLEADELAGHPEALHFEETLLFLLIRLRNPHARVIYVTSQPLPPSVIDYYLQFMAGVPGSDARRRLTLLSAHDTSLRPLTQKILDRPRLIERLGAAIRDRERAYLTVFRSTALERRLAVRLGIPLNGPDPGADRLLEQSGARELLRAAGIDVPPGREHVRTEGGIVDALEFLQATCPGLRHAVLKLNSSYWDEGHALVRLPTVSGRRALEAALQALAFSSPSETRAHYLARFERGAGVVEALIEAAERRTVSAQMRINPLGQVTATSTHDELRGGALGLAARGCAFPAHDDYRAQIQAAGLQVAGLLAAKGIFSRVSVDFVVWRHAAHERWQFAASEVNLGFGGTTHPLLAVRFLAEGGLDPHSGLYCSGAGRPKFYRATDHLQREEYRGLLAEDLIDILTLHQLHYSPQREAGALFYMLGALSEYGRAGLVAVGNSREQAEDVFQRTIATLDRECGVR